LRLIDRFPEHVFDGRVLNVPFTAIKLTDAKATERMRDEAKERMMSFLKDGARILSSSQMNNKNELSRAAISIDFLTEALS